MDTHHNADADEQRAPSLVVIGMPADRIDVLLTLLESLPDDFTAPIVIGQHVDPRHPVQLGEVLPARSRRPVSLVSGQIPLQPGTIFVGPPDRDIEITGDADHGSVQVGSASMPSIDRLLASAARIYADQLVGVILAGTGIDGLAGAQAVKAYGGTVIAQDRGVSEHPGVPPGIVDIVADLNAIGPLLGDLVDGQYTLTTSGEPTELRLFLDRVREQSGVDFRAYKRPTVERRLRRRMAAVGVTSLNAYWRYVDRHPEEMQQLVSAFLIKVTNFFRDPELFSYLRERVLPDLIDHARTLNGELRIWSAGCATGEEAYSVAMLVADLLGDELDRLPVRIFATDVAPDAVDFARRGVYPVTAIADVPAELVDRYFDRLDGAYEVSKAVRSLVVFGEHDLGRRAPFPRIDMVLCRNVLIYFTADLQRRALQRFAFSLRSGGQLVLGKAESVSPLPEFFALEQPRLKVFRRNEATAPVLTDRSLEPSAMQGLTLSRRLPVRRLAPSSLMSSIGPTISEQSIRLLDRLSLGVVVIDRTYDIRHINVAARRLLDIHGAGIGEDLIHQVPQALGSPLRSAIDTALGGTASTITHSLPPDVAHEQGRDLSISCSPVPDEDASSVQLVHIEVDDITAFAQRQRELEAERNALATEREELGDRSRAAGVAVRELRAANDTMAAELGRVRAENEQLQLAHEEVQAAAEEIETLNEEQQAANEELETLNEELQATVEELNTANSELEARTVQLETLASTLEARRLESEEWFRALIEDASDYAIFTTDATRRIDSWTPGAERIFGWTTEEAVGQMFDILFTPEDRRASMPRKELETARETGQASDMRWHLRQDGSRIFIEGSSRARRDPDGGFLGLLKIGRDTTERQLSEQRRLETEEQARQELERRVAESTDELRALSRRLLQVQEEERRHLARELHDEIGQMLTGLQFQLASAPAGGAGLEEAQQTVRDLTEQVRQLSMDLRPAALDGYGLAPALEWHLDRFRRRTGIAVELRHEGVNRRFSAETEVTAYRLVQEALTNLARHSEASTAIVQLLADAQTLTVSIRDDGKGFDPALTTNGSGLLGMRERVALLGGAMEIDAAPGDGVAITAELPINDADDNEAAR